MNDPDRDSLRIFGPPALEHATLVLAFTGWMDGGDVSTGTVSGWSTCCTPSRSPRSIPSRSTSTTSPARWRSPPCSARTSKIEEGLIKKSRHAQQRVLLPQPAANLAVLPRQGAEPALADVRRSAFFSWPGTSSVSRIVFVGSFGGAVPHTREPRLYVTCSDAGAAGRRWSATACAAATTRGRARSPRYLMTQATRPAGDGLAGGRDPRLPAGHQPDEHRGRHAAAGQDPQAAAGPRCLAQRASTERGTRGDQAVEQNEELAETVHKLEEAYDNELLQFNGEEA